ncbi:MAG: hypothetical protein JOZ00_02495 [Mycobacterium sp.]|uniref:hypothetical protein n=1 Tax=Mycobacterium sp. TaxID=1785 RepID=UPI001EC4EEAF|nr:hypothetical protein [Mycobacterium sp.]MBV8785538.1 hypothetical protein [Mycobacterium sp.]
MLLDDDIAGFGFYPGQSIVAFGPARQAATTDLIDERGCAPASYPGRRAYAAGTNRFYIEPAYRHEYVTVTNCLVAQRY